MSRPLTTRTPAARHRQGPPPPPSPPATRRSSTRDELVYVALTHVIPAVCFTSLGVIAGVVFSR